jgi:hypothetical protein
VVLIVRSNAVVLFETGAAGAYLVESAATAERMGASPQSRARSGAPVAWTPNHELDAHEWAAAGRRIGAVGRCIQWLLGDWIAYGNAKFGERYARAAKITGYDAQTLMNMVYVASRFPISRRREALSWSHHETLAALGVEEQDRWLDQAATHRWSVADLRMMVRSSRGREPVAEDSRRKVEDGGGLSAGDGEARPDRSPGAVVTCPRCGEAVSL